MLKLRTAVSCLPDARLSNPFQGPRNWSASGLPHSKRLFFKVTKVSVKTCIRLISGFLGLAAYRPGSNKQPHLLRRFPKRNKQIAEYIQRETGQKRTAKQVGSRLQQLRETCEDPESRLYPRNDFDVYPSAFTNI